MNSMLHNPTDAQNYEKAMEWYEKRAVKGGWDEEVWYWYTVWQSASAYK